MSDPINCNYPVAQPDANGLYEWMCIRAGQPSEMNGLKMQADLDMNNFDILNYAGGGGPPLPVSVANGGTGISDHGATVTTLTFSGTTAVPIRNTSTALVDPTPADDVASGWRVGSRWVNVVTDEEWVMVQSVAPAIWKQTTSAGGGPPLPVSVANGGTGISDHGTTFTTLTFNGMTAIPVRNTTTALVDPTVADDFASGWRIGSRWVNTTTDQEWVMVQQIGPAIWKQTTGAVAPPPDASCYDAIVVGFGGGSDFVFTFPTILDATNNGKQKICVMADTPGNGNLPARVHEFYIKAGVNVTTTIAQANAFDTYIYGPGNMSGLGNTVGNFNTGRFIVQDVTFPIGMLITAPGQQRVEFYKCKFGGQIQYTAATDPFFHKIIDCELTSLIFDVTNGSFNVIHGNRVALDLSVGGADASDCVITNNFVGGTLTVNSILADRVIIANNDIRVNLSFTNFLVGAATSNARIIGNYIGGVFTIGYLFCHALNVTGNTQEQGLLNEFNCGGGVPASNCKSCVFNDNNLGFHDFNGDYNECTWSGNTTNSAGGVLPWTFAAGGTAGETLFCAFTGNNLHGGTLTFTAGCILDESTFTGNICDQMNKLNNSATGNLVTGHRGPVGGWDILEYGLNGPVNRT